MRNVGICKSLSPEPKPPKPEAFVVFQKIVELKILDLRGKGTVREGLGFRVER